MLLNGLNTKSVQPMVLPLTDGQMLAMLAAMLPPASPEERVAEAVEIFARAVLALPEVAKRLRELKE